MTPAPPCTIIRPHTPIAFQWNQPNSQLISTGVSLVIKLTVWLTWLFPKTGCNIRLHFPQRRWLQSFKVNLNHIQVWIPKWRLSRLNDVYHSPQLVTYKQMSALPDHVTSTHYTHTAHSLRTYHTHCTHTTHTAHGPHTLHTYHIHCTHTTHTHYIHTVNILHTVHVTCSSIYIRQTTQFMWSHSQTVDHNQQRCYSKQPATM
jgi:hypothetical protein